MKNFIKKNPFLFIVVTLSTIVCLYFLFEIISGHSEINDSIEKIDANTEKVERINRAHDPNFVKQSERRIMDDSLRLKEYNELLRRRFGKPNRVALQHFLSTLGGQQTPGAPAIDSDANVQEKLSANATTDKDFSDVTEETLRAVLKELWEKAVEDKRETGVYDKIPNNRDIEDVRNELFALLRERIISQGDANRLEARARRFDLAFELFTQDIQKGTLERIDSVAAQQVFLDALGLPRQKEPRKCRAFVEAMCRAYNESDLIPGYLEKRKNAEAAQKELKTADPKKQIEVYDFLCARDVMTESKPPNPGRVISIMRNFQILEDLFRRMKEAGIQDLVSISAEQDNLSSGDFLSYAYTITVKSNLNEIGAFVNSLHSACDSNRVYVIRKMSFLGNPEEAPSADKTVIGHLDAIAAAEAASKAKEKADADGSKEIPVAPAAKDETNTFTEVFPLSNPKNPEYGMVLLGGRREVTCVIEVEYLLYQADNLFKQ